MSIEAMKQALEALTYLTKPMAKGWDAETQMHKRDNAITALRTAIAEAEKQEPVAWQWLDTAHFRKKIPIDATPSHWRPLYTAPQPAQQPLSQYHIDRIVGRLQVEWPDYFDSDVATQLVRAIEAAHGIKGEPR